MGEWCQENGIEQWQLQWQLLKENLTTGINWAENEPVRIVSLQAKQWDRSGGLQGHDF